MKWKLNINFGYYNWNKRLLNYIIKVLTLSFFFVFIMLTPPTWPSIGWMRIWILYYREWEIFLAFALNSNFMNIKFFVMGSLFFTCLLQLFYVIVNRNQPIKLLKFNLCNGSIIKGRRTECVEFSHVSQFNIYISCWQLFLVSRVCL